MKLRLALAATALLIPFRPASGAVAIHGVSDADAVTAAATSHAVGSSYAFSTVLSGKPVRWNPCVSIHYLINPNGAPAGGVDAVRSAVARVAQATGTHWVLDGVTGVIPTTAWLPRTASQRQPVLIGWTDAAHSDLLRGQASSVLGVTRTSWFGHTSAAGTVVAIRSAVIALDRTDRIPARGSESWRSVTLHELGHAMGLAHAGSSRQLMYPVLGHALSDLQPGDLTGLARLGRTQGCITL